ncbi:hypothetical protein ACFLRC_05180, partial [Candidatus Altiarchaeota archaeon]
CYQDYAISQQRATLCLNINYQDTKVRCIAVVTGDQNACFEIDDEGRQEQCMSDATLLSKNEEGCTTIQTGKNRDMCFWDNAKVQRDPSICLSIEDLQIQEWCILSANAR